MISAVFVGSDSAFIGDTEYDEVGQKASFTEKSFIEAINGGACFIPEKSYRAVGFTADELAAYGPAGLRHNPTNDFCQKLALAQQVFRDLQSLLSREEARQNILSSIADI
jgi:hypothetical protein